MRQVRETSDMICSLDLGIHAWNWITVRVQRFVGNRSAPARLGRA
jgi:hypothetical protein